MLPAPIGVFRTLLGMVRTEEFRFDLGETVLCSFIGLLAGAGIAIPLGTSMALSRPVHGFFEPLVKGVLFVAEDIADTAADSMVRYRCDDKT